MPDKGVASSRVFLPVPLFRPAAPHTPADPMSAHVDAFLMDAAFPVTVAGSASALNLSRPAQPPDHSPGVTRVAAGRIAQPPKAAFVARLQPGRLPSQTARQLPDPSTSIRVEPSSTRETRRQGAHGDTPGFTLFIRAVPASRLVAALWPAPARARDAPRSRPAARGSRPERVSAGEEKQAKFQMINSF
jgi:hypothetical protein